MKAFKTLAVTGSLSALALLGSASSARASLYGNFVGANLSYDNVTETDSEFTEPPPTNSNPTGFFGAPEIDPAASNILTFPDMTFSAQAGDGEFVFQDGKLTYDIVPIGTTNIQSLNFDEGGAFHLIAPAGAPATDASVEATLLFNGVDITSVNGVALSTPVIVSPTFTYSVIQSAGTVDVADETNGDITLDTEGGNAVGTWDISANFNLASALSSAGYTGQITEISVALDDQLTANSADVAGNNTLADIDKKHFVITPIIIPEPGTLSMLMGAGLLLGRWRKAVSRSR